jgi:hypothetical protein
MCAWTIFGPSVEGQRLGKGSSREAELGLDWAELSGHEVLDAAGHGYAVVTESLEVARE